MGCGASSAPRYKTGEVTEKHDSADFQSHDSTKSNEVTKINSQDAWHAQHCSDADLQIAYTIHDAHPFDESERQKVTVHTKFGNDKVTVAKLGPKSLFCHECRDHIISRNQHKPFYFCLRCRRDGKRYNVCMKCADGRNLSQGIRTGRCVDGTASTSSDMFAMRSVSRQPTDPMDASVGETSHRTERFLNVNSGSTTQSHDEAPMRNSPRVSSRGASPRHSQRPTSPAASPRQRPSTVQSQTAAAGANKSQHVSRLLPSGVWKGKLSEGTSNRDAIYQLIFSDALDVGGSGPDGCKVAGSAAQKVSTEYNERKVMWRETHAWGTISFNGGAYLSDAPIRISGTFHASDGGGGKIELRFCHK